MTDSTWLEPKKDEEVGRILSELRRRLEPIYVSLEHDVSIATIFTTEERWQSSDSAFLRTIREEGRAA